MAGEKTEKATPKRRDEARKKGQVARSMDVNGAIVLLVGLIAITAFGSGLYEQMRASMQSTFALMATPEVVDREGVGKLFTDTFRAVGLAVAPIALLCVLAGLASSVAQVRWKPSPKAIKPDPKRLNPLQGAKNIFGPNALFEGAKTIVKMTIVGAIAAMAVFPALPELAGLVGLPPVELASQLVSSVSGVAFRAVGAYCVIAAADYLWQRHRHEKGLKMDMQEVKEEMKQYALPAEVRSAIRRRQMEQARARMMSAVPDADVVVTNPTHFAVALRYDGSKAAPEVVAKGQDLIAMQIRRLADEHSVPVISDPPLARSLHESVEVGHPIPGELYEAVAQLLAFVYRVAGRRAV